jgi:hypothetical protein
MCSGEKLMNIIRRSIDILFNRKTFIFPNGQVAILIFLISVCSLLILHTIRQAALNSVFLFCFVSVFGLVLCHKTQISLNDPSLKVLGYFWLIKICLTIVLLYVGWMPQLDQATSDSWGYDPQRYYIQAQDLIENEWSPDFISLNYLGILYYYGAIFHVFGHNPINPALINAFITLIATLYLVKVGYVIAGKRSAHDWTLAFALLLPEILWFDVMTSRETLLAALILFAMLTTGIYLTRRTSISLFNVLIVVSLFLIAIASIRISMLLPVLASIALMAWLVKSQRGLRGVMRRVILAVFVSGALLVGPVITTYVGGYHFEMGKALQTAFSAEENIALTADAEWSEDSIGMLLMPEGLLQALLFLPIRMVLYLVAPIPNIFVPVSDLLSGSWAAWQKIITIVSSLINVIAIPYVLSSLLESVKNRKVNSAPLVFHISYWFAFIAIAGGNLIIQERYRVMASLLLFGCAWLGFRTHSKRLIVRMSLLWYGLLFFGALFYVSYKFDIV